MTLMSSDEMRRDPFPTYARLEGRIALGQILQLAPELTIAQSEPWAPRPGVIVHGPRALRVRARPEPAIA